MDKCLLLRSIYKIVFGGEYTPYTLELNKGVNEKKQENSNLYSYISKFFGTWNPRDSKNLIINKLTNKSINK